MPNVSQLKTLGEIIRTARQSKGWSLKLLSEQSGVGYSYTSNIERGYVNAKRGPVTPSDDILFALAHTLGIPLSRLHAVLGRTDSSETEKQPEAQDVLNSIRRLLADPEDAIQQQTTGSPPQTTDSPPPVTQREMRRHATRLTGEVRARNARVALAEAVIWTVDMNGRFLLSEGDGLKQAAISPGEAVGLRIWDVYKDEMDFLEKVRMVLASDGPLEWTTTVRGTAWRCMTEPLRDAQGTKIGIVGTSLAVPAISESQKQG